MYPVIVIISDEHEIRELGNNKLPGAVYQSLLMWQEKTTGHFQISGYIVGDDFIIKKCVELREMGPRHILNEFIFTAEDVNDAIERMGNPNNIINGLI